LKDEEIPADVLCIKAPKDTVFVSTMNLDGETNLKERKLPFYKD
jgi:magnesium-transporting ATPase (P-type)